MRFSDPETQIADMNGDGLADIVRVRDGKVLYWPGRGNGFFGTGNRGDCAHEGFAEARHVDMNNAPRFGTVDAGTLLLNDVNGDGLADMVEVRNQGVDIYLNDAGIGWTVRHTIADTPFRPAGSNYVRLADIDGSGTPDILWGRANEYRYIDLTGRKVPHLLTRVKNGLGKTAELVYQSSTSHMLDAATAGKPWTKFAPTSMPLLVRSIVRDNLSLVGRPAGVYVTEYAYRDPVYEGRQREFRGFSEATVTTLGDANSPTAHQRTVFQLGECSLAYVGTSSDVCSPAQRWQDNWRESLKGLPVTAESYDDQGKYLATEHSTYKIRQLYTGLDGRRVTFVTPVAKDTFVYDTASFDGQRTAATLDEVRIESHGHLGHRNAPGRRARDGGDGASFVAKCLRRYGQRGRRHPKRVRVGLPQRRRRGHHGAQRFRQASRRHVGLALSRDAFVHLGLGQHRARARACQCVQRRRQPRVIVRRTFGHAAARAPTCRRRRRHCPRPFGPIGRSSGSRSDPGRRSDVRHLRQRHAASRAERSLQRS